jgi:hypothetical protein
MASTFVSIFSKLNMKLQCNFLGNFLSCLISLFILDCAPIQGFVDFSLIGTYLLRLNVARTQFLHILDLYCVVPGLCLDQDQDLDSLPT